MSVYLIVPGLAVVDLRVSSAVRPGHPNRLIVESLFFKLGVNDCDPGGPQDWGERPTWRCVSGYGYFEHFWPSDWFQSVRFREPLEPVHAKLVVLSMAKGIELSLAFFANEGQPRPHRAGQYAQIRQFKRMRRTTRRQSTIVGRLQRRMSVLGLAAQKALDDSLNKAKGLLSKAQGKQIKRYRWYAPEAECISKGKSRNPFEFGDKGGLASTLNGNLIVGGRAYPARENRAGHHPDAGHRNQTGNGLGGPGLSKNNPGLNIKHWGRFKSISISAGV